MWRDTLVGTFAVAAVLCVACSLMVSGAAQGLKDRIEENEEVDKKKNVLLAAGLCEKNATKDAVNKIFKTSIREVVVDFATGQPLSDSEVTERFGAKYDAGKASKDPSLQVAIEPADALMGVRHRAPASPVYQVVDGDQVQGFIFPVEGKGLWSTLKGFLAIEADGTTVRGITFYSHAETPGLGGEVDNEGWKAKWQGKKVFGEGGDVALGVIKGTASSEYQIDGLSGATITSNGVSGIVSYWMGDNGFGPFLKSQADTEG